MSSLISILVGLLNGVLDLVLLPWSIWRWLQLPELKERMSALTLAGQSVDFLYMMLALLIIVCVAGYFNRRFLRGTVLTLEVFNRRVGQTASWFVLMLMLQQVLIIVVGQVFRGNELYFAPFGMDLAAEELQWLSGQLKFYNTLLIALASAYTFIEGGHVRVDLVYGNLRRRTKHWVDLVGSLLFMLPLSMLLWWFAWPLATNSMFSQRPMNIFSDKASWRGFKWESSGTAEFTWVWAFKAMILVFAALLFLQAVAFLLRNLWALLEPDAEVESHPVDPFDAVSSPDAAGVAAVLPADAMTTAGPSESADTTPRERQQPDHLPMTAPPSQAND
ncbi:MAG: hypothetical protein CSB44_03070 [Gammaproteobacteria bacterium]|nr:MAG: hypothetical protein CSB44_03070 [Gammaproteobacteria bacterium]